MASIAQHGIPPAERVRVQTPKFLKASHREFLPLGVQGLEQLSQKKLHSYQQSIAA
jgi:hypothetical protein